MSTALIKARSEAPITTPRHSKPMPANEMGPGASHREGADQHPERQAPSLPEPAGHDLEAGRVDTGEGNPGERVAARRPRRSHPRRAR